MLSHDEKRAFRLMVGITVLAILLFADSVGAVPVEEWNKTFGGNGNEGAKSVQQTADGGYILAGYAFSSGYGALLIKTDANGNQQWGKIFGGAVEGRAESVKQTSDGGYVLAGYSSRTGIDALMIKTDADGNQIWNKTFGGAGPDEFHSIQQTSDGGYILAGKTYTYDKLFMGAKVSDDDAWLVKTDANGNQQWNKTFGDLYADEFNSVQQTSDGGYILAGRTQVAGTDEAWLVKTDINGNELWNKKFEGKSTSTASSVQETPDDGYIFVGYSTDSNMKPYGVDSRSDASIIKTDPYGNVQWKKTFGGAKSDAAYSVQKTNDDGYIIAGYTESYGSGNDAWLIKTDPNGNEQWNNTFGRARAFSVEQTSDNGYILVGYNVSLRGITDAWLLKLSGETSVTTRVPTASPTEEAETTRIQTISPTEKADETKSPTASPTEKVVGFEVVLVIAAISLVYMFILKRK
jgi:hypothetical protein